MLQDLFENFAKYEKAVTEYLIEHKDEYFGSQCFKSLKKRYTTLRDSVDMVFPRNNGFISKLAMPVVKPRKLLRRAILSMNFRNDPIVMLSPLPGTDKENAKNMQQALDLNFKHTKFRDKCFQQMKDDSATYGSYVVMQQYQFGGDKKVWRTIYSPNGASPYTRQYMPASQTKNIVNVPIHVLNYFQESEIHDPDESKIRGTISRENIGVLINDYEANPKLYIQENVEKLIRDAMKGNLYDKNFYEKDNKISEFVKNKIDRVRCWFQLFIPGNEDDDTIYYAEMVNQMIIRFQDNPLDQNIVPLVCGGLRKRFDYWWYNTDTEDVIPHQSFTNLMTNMSADMAIKMMQHYILYPKDAIDISDILNAPSTNNFVPINRDALFGNSVQNMFTMFQPTDTSYNLREWVWQKIERNQQDLNPHSDLSRPYDQGGPSNKTATGAQLMNERSEALEMDLSEVFAQGLIDIGRKDVIMLQQFLGDMFMLAPINGMQAQQIEKFRVLGDFSFDVNSALTKNKAGEFQRIYNILTAIENFKGTPDPTWQRVDTGELAKQLLSLADIGDLESVYKEAPPMSMPGMIPQGAPMPANTGTPAPVNAQRDNGPSLGLFQIQEQQPPKKKKKSEMAAA